MGYAIHLLSQDDLPVRIEAAASISIDGDGELTVYRDGGEQLAVFARGAWAYAVNTDPGEKREQPSGLGSLFVRPSKATG